MIGDGYFNLKRDNEQSCLCPLHLQTIFMTIYTRYNIEHVIIYHKEIIIGYDLLIETGEGVHSYIIYSRGI